MPVLNHHTRVVSQKPVSQSLPSVYTPPYAHLSSSSGSVRRQTNSRQAEQSTKTLWTNKSTSSSSPLQYVTPQSVLLRGGGRGLLHVAQVSAQYTSPPHPLH